MRKTLITVAVVALAALVATTSFAASRGASFTPVGLFPMCNEVPPGEFCENFPITTVTGMTADGQTIVGMHAFFQGGYIWTADAGINGTVGPIYSGMSISRAGDVIASTRADETFSFEQSAIYDSGFYPNEVWSYIPLADGFAPCGASGQNVYDTSSSMVVGLTWIDEDGNGNGCEGARAFAWTEAGGTTVLDDSLSGTGSYRANAVNEDGSVITGWSAPGRTASAWINGTETYLCTGDQADWFCNEGWDVTPDGATILFTGAAPGEFNARASTYDVATGAVQQLPYPPTPGDPFWDTFSGWAISDDGNTVVGEFGGGGFFGSPPYPVVYVESLDMTIDLQVMLLGQGLDDLFFWFLSDATAVNADGTIIAGSGFNPDGWIEAYQVDISKVKVCHKPDGNGQGNDRTIAIGWDSVGDHLAHGDVLATCEFASSDAASRFAQRRSQINASMSPDADARMKDIGQLMRIREAVTGQSYDGAPTTTSFRTIGENTDEQTHTQQSTPEERRESLRKRLQRPALKR